MWIVAIADIVMSLDNVIAIAAAAETAAARVDIGACAGIKTILIVFGLATSVPLIIAGSALADGAAGPLPDPGLGRRRLLGWVAGEIMIKDAAVVALARRGSWSTSCISGPRRPARCSWSRLGWLIRRAHHKRALERR